MLSPVKPTAKRASDGRAKLTARRIVAYSVFILLSFLCVIFFYIMLINASRAHAEIQVSFSFWPGKHFMRNLSTLMANEQLPVFTGMLNSLFVAGATCILTTYFSTMTAYAIHAYRFRMRKFAWNFILLVMMIPTQVSALGFVRMLIGWGLMDTYYPLILPTIAAPVVFFFMKQYMESALPVEIVEAARIDGSGEFHTFNHIVLPIMKPAIAVQMIFTFVTAWNNYFTPALIIRTNARKTLPILIAQLRTADFLKFDMGQVYMMITLSILPIIVVYLLLSKFIVRGVALGSIKG